MAAGAIPALHRYNRCWVQVQARRAGAMVPGGQVHDGVQEDQVQEEQVQEEQVQEEVQEDVQTVARCMGVVQEEQVHGGGTQGAGV